MQKNRPQFNGVEVTPEMIEAGTPVLEAEFAPYGLAPYVAERVLREIYIKMDNAKRQIRPLGGGTGANDSAKIAGSLLGASRD